MSADTFDFITKRVDEKRSRETAHDTEAAAAAYSYIFIISAMLMTV